MKCPDCDGRGAFNAICDSCNGSGKGITEHHICTACQGEGECYYKCPTCKGTGEIQEEETMNKKCIDCSYCVRQEYGYSNYTVEGVEVHCLLDANPKFPVDSFYGEEPELKYANQCEKFLPGDCVDIDCDREWHFPNGYSDNPVIRELLIKWDTQY